VTNPGSTGDGVSAQATLDEARAFFVNGEFFRSYDIAVAGLSHQPQSVLLAHRAVLSLANAGATELALAKFHAFGLDRGTDLEMRALLGRLKKDQALAATGDAKQHLLAEARTIYEAAYHTAFRENHAEAYYPGINAATLALLSGDTQAATHLARAVLGLLAGRIDACLHGEQPDRYWVLATAIEAHLVAGDVAHAHRLVAPAVAASGQNYTDLATTGRQLERILRAKNLDPDTLAAFTPPTIVHYVGHIIAAPGQPGRFPADEEAAIATRIAEVLDTMRIGAAYGSLAAGADLLFAEALQARGIAVNIVLPFRIEDMLEQSVRPAGQHWVSRFETCLNAAKTVRYATEDRYLGDDHLFTYCSRLAMGLAVLVARHLHAPLRQLALWDGEARAGVAGTVADMQAWANAGHARTVIKCGARHATDDLDTYVPPAAIPGRRDTRAMLFGDIQAFSKLTDAQLPIFAAQIMGAAGRVVRAYADKIAFVNTWGDGIFAVFPDAGQAAHCALALQQAMRAIDFAGLGLPADLRLRLGGHLGPVYELPDPILGRLNYYGVHVSRAARIEPVTPEGCVYVTETFAAVLALHNAHEFACDYVGYTAMAKDHGRLRMFLLRRASADAGPAAIADIERAPVVPPGTPS
jgi:class 3 adenylate cyclase